ncbi:MAG: NUDIX hydrolase [Simkaniaceae bacterium]|nr:NUDIX hydrolase [Simkaniaceae bacterium]
MKDYSKESVNAIVFDESRSKALLIKRRDVPVWVLPGGGIEKGESPATAALRELFEETGCKMKILRKVGEYFPVCRLAKVTHFFECQIISGDLSIGVETKEIQFFPLTKLPKKIPPPYPDWIQDATKNHPCLLKKKITSVTYKAFIKYLFSHPILVLRFLLSKIGLHINS